MSPNQGSCYINESLYTQWRRRRQIMSWFGKIFSIHSVKRDYRTPCVIKSYLCFCKIFFCVQKSGKMYGKPLTTVSLSREKRERERWGWRGNSTYYGLLEIFTIITHDIKKTEQFPNWKKKWKSVDITKESYSQVTEWTQPRDFAAWQAALRVGVRAFPLPGPPAPCWGGHGNLVLTRWSAVVNWQRSTTW